jgi:hypothetical protein
MALGGPSCLLVEQVRTGNPGWHETCGGRMLLARAGPDAGLLEKARRDATFAREDGERGGGAAGAAGLFTEGCVCRT